MNTPIKMITHGCFISRPNLLFSAGVFGAILIMILPVLTQFRVVNKYCFKFLANKPLLPHTFYALDIFALLAG